MTPTFLLTVENNKVKITSKSNFEELPVDDLVKMVAALQPDTILELLLKIISLKLSDDKLNQLTQALTAMTVDSSIISKEEALKRKIAVATTFNPRNRKA